MDWQGHRPSSSLAGVIEIGPITKIKFCPLLTFTDWFKIVRLHQRRKIVILVDREKEDSVHLIIYLILHLDSISYVAKRVNN